MKDLFDLKKGEHKLFDKPQKFYEIWSSGSSVSFQEKITYGVWHHSRIVKRKRINIFHFQSEYNKGTRSFDWWLPVNDVAMTIKDALTISKARRIELAKESLVRGERIIKVNNIYLKDYSNFEPVLEQNEYQKRTKKFSINFPKLTEIRQSISS